MDLYSDIRRSTCLSSLVGIYPGLTALTLMFLGPRSTARHLTMWSMAALDIGYVMLAVVPILLNTLEMATMLPWVFSRWGTASWIWIKSKRKVSHRWVNLTETQRNKIKNQHKNEYSSFSSSSDPAARGLSPFGLVTYSGKYKYFSIGWLFQKVYSVCLVVGGVTLFLGHLVLYS